MPIHRGKDFLGSFYQWGNQKKYYYISGNKDSRIKAKDKAVKQARAIYSSGYKNKN